MASLREEKAEDRSRLSYTVSIGLGSTKQVCTVCILYFYMTAAFIFTNRKQVANMQALHRQKFRLSHDALYNLHELAYDITEFVHKISTFPDLVVVCGLKPMLKEVNHLLQLHLKTSHQLLSHDTTFQLGDFYVSTFLFRNIMFKKSPVMPATFLFHERKLRTTHLGMMEIVASHLPSLVHGKARIPMVTRRVLYMLLTKHCPMFRVFIAGIMLNCGYEIMELCQMKSLYMLATLEISFIKPQGKSTMIIWKNSKLTGVKPSYCITWKKFIIRSAQLVNEAPVFSIIYLYYFFRLFTSCVDGIWNNTSCTILWVA